jgi:selenocysteine-specific elongation factor
MSRFYVLGTAGHIDHGKTALVGLLTGTDTDRLKEEKARGISIDLGFAHLDLPGGISCGIVDVPGHERFIKNMLAGACGIDAVLFVIAADEGVMPQTREHLDILDLLGVRRGVVALTKIDMVEPDWRELVGESVSQYLGERGFGHFPILPVSSRTGEGKEELLQGLAAVLADLPERSSERSARLPVDRAFTVEGFGTVVTGTLWRGTLRPGDRVVIQPGEIETRIRNVEVHGAEVAEARAGQRTAVAVAGVSRDKVPRGSWVLAPGTLVPSHMLDVRLRVLPDAPRPLRNRQRIRFHLGASEVLGRVSLLEEEAVPAGEEGLAQIRLEGPVVADRGDRFVLRFYSPPRTLAGGSVILPVAPKRRRGQGGALEELRREEKGSPAERIRALVEGEPAGISPADAALRLGLSAEQLHAHLAPLQAAGVVGVLENGLLVSALLLTRLADTACRALETHHRDQPFRWGLGRGELKSRLGTGLPAPLFDHLLRELAASGRVSEKDGQVRLGDGKMALPAGLQDRVDRVERVLEEGAVSPPTLKEIQKQLGFPVLEILEYLTFEGRAVKVTPELFLNRLQFQKLTKWLEGFFHANDELAVSQLRDVWGMSRKYSVPILECLDREGWTRREGDVRTPGRRLTG